MNATPRRGRWLTRGLLVISVAQFPTHVAVGDAEVTKDTLFLLHDFFIVALSCNALLLSTIPLEREQRRLLHVRLAYKLCSKVEEKKKEGLEYLELRDDP